MEPLKSENEGLEIGVHNKAIKLVVAAMSVDPSKRVLGDVTAGDIVEIMKLFGKMEKGIIHG